MPRYGPTIHQVHIADGFADDCDELVHQCTKIDNLNFQEFCKIWKRMKIGCLYEGRTLSAEIAELSEEVIHIAKHYMLKNTSNFEESVAGLFIVYSLLNLQPYAGFARLRIVAEDIPAIERIDYVARRDKRHDVLYILASVLIKGPVHYHATERQYGMDLAIRKYLEGYTSIDKLGVRPKGVFYRQNEELDIMRELGSITRAYTKAKMEISETSEFERNLKYINDNLSTDLESSLKKLISGIHEEQYGFLGGVGDDDDDDEKLYRSRRAIKERAMKGGVQPLKHLVNADDKTTVAKEKPSRRLRKRQKQVKVKILKSPAMSHSERKRRIPLSPRAMKKSRYNNECDMFPRSSTDTESTSDSDDSEVETKKKPDLAPIDFAERLQAHTPAGKDTVEDTEDTVVQELDIQIDTLPVFIRTEDQGKVYEIEIIDSAKEPPPPKPIFKTYARKDSVLRKISSMPGLTIKKIELPAGKTEPAEVAGTSAPAVNDLAKILEIKPVKDDKKAKPDTPGEPRAWPGIHHVEKRNMKRVHMKSKFKRLGILPIANFEPPENLGAVDEDFESEESEVTTATLDDSSAVMD